MRPLAGKLAALALSAGLLGVQKPANVSVQFEPAQIVSAAEAFYPPTSIASGTVVLRLTVGESGQVEDVRVVRDIPSLTQEAVRSAMKWKFRPAALDGRPIRTGVVAAFTFVNPTLIPNIKS